MARNALDAIRLDRIDFGISYDPATGDYTCTPNGYSDIHFPPWFCSLANAIAEYSQPGLSLTRKWVTHSKHALPGKRNNSVRPDFVLAFASNDPTKDSTQLQAPPLDSPPTRTPPMVAQSPGIGNGVPDPTPPPWDSVLIVGEHESSGSTIDRRISKLATYAEQVFIAQPFRMGVFAILTSKKSTNVSFWWFDRAGAVGSEELEYGSSQAHLLTLVRALHALHSMPSVPLGFHATGILWNPQMPFPTNEQSKIVCCLDILDIPLDQSPFVATGIVGRGTRVWQSIVSHAGTSTAVAVKYSWRSTGRVPEGELYNLAYSRGAVGLAKLIDFESYEDIQGGLRRNYIPSSNPQIYKTHMDSHNRIFNRLIFGTTGATLRDAALAPLDIARALLAALIGHASLFFEAHILHRDLSPSNILFCHDPISISSPTKTCPEGTKLYGCIIDLDYAIDIIDYRTSGAADRTGTYPYIAIDILSGKPHRYRHDVESLFYVLLWVCCYPCGDSKAADGKLSSARQGSKSRSSTRQESYRPAPNSRPAEIWPTGDPLRIWYTADMETVAAHKISNVITRLSEFESLFEHFREGFEAFEGTAQRLREALWGVDGTPVVQLAQERRSPDEAVRGPREEAGESGVGYSERREQWVRDTEPQGTACKEKQTPKPKRRGKGYSDHGSKKQLLVEASELRPGVSDWEGYLEVRTILEELVQDLQEEWDTENMDDDKGTTSEDRRTVGVQR